MAANREDGMEIRISTELLSSRELKEHLEGHLEPAQDVELELRRRTTRSIDPEVLVALVGAGGAAIHALIVGIFQVLSAKQGQKIVIQGSNGRRVEATGQRSAEEIEDLVRQAREIDAQRIIVR